MLKNELRKIYLQKRKAISTKKASEFHENILANFEQFLPQEIRTAHIYLPIIDKAEIDTWPIIKFLWSKNIQVVVPKIESNTLMTTWHLTPETKLVENQYKVPEPIDAELANNESIDMIILPLLVCDIHGNRVGYGKGYYDAFLSSINRDLLKVGLGYFSPIDEKFTVNTWDVPLDYCITPEAVVRF